MTSQRPRTGQLIDLTAGPWDHEARCHTELPGGFELRVADAVPGEQLEAAVEHVSRGGPVGWAKISRLKRPHPARREPLCPIHGLCGACGVQHVEDDAQLAIKVESARAGLPESLWAELAPAERWIRSPSPFGYRHKAVWLPGERGGRLTLGGYARGTHDVIDLAECGVLDHRLRALHQAFVALMPEAPRGLRGVVARASRSGELLATVIVHKRDHRWAETVRDLPVAGVHLQLHDAPGDAITGNRELERLAGRSWVEETVAGRPFRLLPLAFFQVNPGVLDGVVATIAAALPEAGAVLDVYCGGGVLGLATTEPGRSVVGIDTSEDSVRSARLDADRQGRPETRWEVGTPRDVLTEFEPGAFAAAILDPPRAGLRGPDLEALVRLQPETIAYVSCHTPSLARDAAALIAAGWRPRDLVPADMLPQTPHVEWVATFGRS